MIERLRLQNFKCFEDQILEFRPLTLLSGLNGMGKSSVLQSLLLLRQSHEHGLLDRRELVLNGDLVCIGTARDALYESAERDLICFELAAAGAQARWCFEYGESDANVLNITPTSSPPESYVGLSLFGDNFHYINAERTGPRTTFEISDSTVRQHRQLGPRGEYTAHFLSVFGRDDIPNEALAHPGAESLKLRDQVEAWLGEVSPGTRLHFTAHPGMDIVNLQYSFVTGQQVPSNQYRSTNVGFGLTYILPVLVAVLASPRGALVLCENPEAHLHPKGQVLMGELMARAASVGIQVVTETHSDHVLNGIRLSVHADRIAPSDVKLHFFQRREHEGQSRSEVVSPQIDPDGRIDAWPEGFFDEWDRSLESLLEPKGV